MRAKVLAAGAVLLFSLTHATNAAVWGFGDSNLDNGWFTVYPNSGLDPYDNYLRQASYYGVGKQTNNPGPMSIEVLAGLLGVTAASAVKPGGTNFAVSGAKNINTNAPMGDGFPNAVPTATQIKSFLSSHTIGTSDVVLIDSGGNDITYALKLNPADAQPYLQQQAGGLAKMIKGLQVNGATHVVIINQPESFGTTAAQAARHFYNTALRSSLNSLGVIHAWGDRNRVRQDIVADPSKFNMLYTDNTAAHTACAGTSQFPTDWAIVCSSNTYAPVHPRDWAGQTLFADDGHWASNGQRILGSYYYCLVKAKWPSLVPPPNTFPPPPRPPYACGAFSEFAATPPL